MRYLLLCLAVLTASTAAFAHHPGNDCPRGLHNRTAEEVLEAHRLALATGDWVMVGCNYAPDAKVISDGGVTEGRADIVLALQGLSAAFGGTIPQLNEEVVVSILNGNTYMARVLFSISTPCVAIPDGTDTYIIRNGQIHAQTAHGFPQFLCGPPPGP